MTTWMNLEGLMLSEIRLTVKDKYSSALNNMGLDCGGPLMDFFKYAGSFFPLICISGLTPFKPFLFKGTIHI